MLKHVIVTTMQTSEQREVDPDKYASEMVIHIDHIAAVSGVTCWDGDIGTTYAVLHLTTGMDVLTDLRYDDVRAKLIRILGGVDALYLA